MNRNLSLIILSISCLLSACISSQPHHSVNADTVTQFDLLSQVQQNIKLNDADNPNHLTMTAAQPVEAWWQLFSDELLNELITQALQKNHDIRIALANMQQARALAYAANSERFPNIDLAGSRVKQQLPDNDINNSSSFTTYEAGFDAQWELDLFGRIKNQAVASKMAFEARVAELEGVYVTVAAEVARIYMELRSAQYRLQVAERNLKNQTHSLALTVKLEQGGRSTDFDIARAQTAVQLTKSLLPPLHARVNETINRLNVLTGHTPDVLKQRLVKPAPLPSLPATIALGDTSSLLQRRSDVRQAEQELAQAIALYNVNVASLYPQISLSGRLGFRAGSSTILGDSGTDFSILGVSISWPLFNRRQVRANVDAADATAQARLARFEQTVLEVLEEIDTAVVNFSHEEQRRLNLSFAAQASKKATQVARQRYEAGIDSYLDVLDAERTQLNAQDQLAVSESEVFIKLVAIYKALGGGWQIVVDPKKAEPPIGSAQETTR